MPYIHPSNGSHIRSLREFLITQRKKRIADSLAISLPWQLIPALFVFSNETASYRDWPSVTPTQTETLEQKKYIKTGEKISLLASSLRCVCDDALGTHCAPKGGPPLTLHVLVGPKSGCTWRRWPSRSANSSFLFLKLCRHKQWRLKNWPRTAAAVAVDVDVPVARGTKRWNKINTRDSRKKRQYTQQQGIQGWKKKQTQKQNGSFMAQIGQRDFKRGAWSPSKCSWRQFKLLNRTARAVSVPAIRRGESQVETRSRDPAEPAAFGFSCFWPDPHLHRK